MHYEWLLSLMCEYSLWISIGGCTLLVVLILRKLSGKRTVKAKAVIRGVEDDKIYPWYQPIMDARTGKLAGSEVLARWHCNRCHIISPDRFIHEVEKSGRIVLMTNLLLQRVAMDLLPVRDQLPENFHLAFNITVAHLNDDSLLRTCLKLKMALPGVILVAEITESKCLEPAQTIFLQLSALRKAGVKVALDDFGTGYAGLSALDRFPVDIIKLDRSFISQIDEKKNDTRILMAGIIADIACQLSLEVVGEGVENLYQQEWLMAHGINLQQGFIYSPPLPAAEFIRRL